MTPRNRFTSIEEQGIEEHVKAQGVDWALLIKAYDAGLSNAAIAKLVGKHKETIANWRPYLKEHGILNSN